MKLNRYITFVSVLMIAFAVVAFAKESEKKRSSLSKTLGTPSYTKLNINQISTWIKNDGESDINQNGNSGVVYPKGSGKTAVFQSGFLWGGRVDGEFRVGGSVYRQGTVPGRIVYDAAGNNTISPDDDDVRIYRVRRDYKDGSMYAELQDGDGSSDAEIRALYEKDWNEWPATQGAPFEDANGNGIYEPDVDVPGVPGADQTVWFVANDLDAAQSAFMYGSAPMGIEEQVTIWGYASTGPLGSMFFRKYTIINKNFEQKPYTDMYVSMWSDVDLGGASDDFVGCDTLLSLSYCYNADGDDEQYGANSPAVGFDFFQGPVVDGEPTDTAHFKGKKIAGKKNLPMTAHYFFINGDNVFTDPPQGRYEGTLQWYNLFRGRVSTSGQPFPDPTTGGSTPFALYGDPITGTGWVDGLLHAPGDRRQGMVSGPFNMAYGDTQEIVVAEIVAGASAGIDRLQAIQLLKAYDDVAQGAYDDNFVLPSAPKQPNTTVSNFDRSLVLNWSVPAIYTETESYSKKGYTFQGYNIYQLPGNTTSLAEAVKIATFDIVDGVKAIVEPTLDPATGAIITKVTQSGGDYGVQRFLQIDKDYIKNEALNNGSTYYFAVTSYSYNPDELAVPHTLENSIIPLVAVPQTTDPGVRYTDESSVTTTHSAGSSDGAVTVSVVDPSKVTGHNYKVNFEEIEGEFLWKLTDVTTNTIKIEQLHQGLGTAAPVVDGLQIEVTGPELKGVSFTSTADRWLTGNSANGGELMFGAAFIGPNFWGETTVAPGELRDLHIDVFKVQSYTDSNADGKYTIGETYVVDPGKGQVVNFYRTWGAGKWLSTGLMPFKFFAIEPDGSQRQLSVIVRDRDRNGQWDPDDQDAYAYNYVFVLNTTYDPTGNDWNPNAGGRDFMDEILANGGPVMWTFWWYPRGTREQFAKDFPMDFVAPKVNLPTDEFTFAAPSIVNNTDLAKEDVEKINVFPNPYYGVNPQEINKYQRFVTFNHLPQRATIRIFNLAGQLVRTITKDNGSQFQRWDLSNNDELPVASGVYVVHIDMPDLGKVKILKAAIIQEQQILDRF